MEPKVPRVIRPVFCKSFLYRFTLSPSPPQYIIGLYYNIVFPKVQYLKVNFLQKLWKTVGRALGQPSLPNALYAVIHPRFNNCFFRLLHLPVVQFIRKSMCSV